MDNFTANICCFDVFENGVCHQQFQKRENGQTSGSWSTSMFDQPNWKLNQQIYLYILCILYILYMYIYIHISSWAEIYVFGFFLCSIWMWKNRAKLLVVTYIDVHPSQYGIIRCHAYINSMSRLHLTLFKLNCWRLNTHLHPIFHV
jgi:hypothetical protein